MGFGEPLPVDRLHNLQNLLDMYEYRPEDVCVNEAIANAADAFRENSTKNAKIDITFDKTENNYFINFRNNAPPMTEQQFVKKYHTVSFSFKEKGKGIGFAGVGAKIFVVAPEGGEIITITGKNGKNFLASKMWKTHDDVNYATTKKHPLSKILGKKKYVHKYGTTYRVRLSDQAYKYLKNGLGGIIQYWWNYGLMSKGFAVTIDGRRLSPWKPKGDEYKRTFTWKKEKISARCFIAKETIPDERLHIIYTVFGKRIYNYKINLARVQPDYANRVFCIVDLSIFADQLTSNKENFKKGKGLSMVNDCRNTVEKNFWKFLDEKGLTSKELGESAKRMVKNELVKRLEDAFRDKAFSMINPFLSTRKRPIPSPDQAGDIPVSEIPGESLGDDEGGKGEGTKPGVGDGTAAALDKDGKETAKMKERRARGIHIIYDDTLSKHNEEAFVALDVGAIIIDTIHPFWLKCKGNYSLKNFNEMRVVIEALIKFKSDELEWSPKETLEKTRDLMHKVWK